MIVRSTKPASKRTASTHARPLPSRAAAALNAASTTTNRAASARPACKATRWWRASALNVTLTPTVGTTTNARYWARSVCLCVHRARVHLTPRVLAETISPSVLVILVLEALDMWLVSNVSCLCYFIYLSISILLLHLSINPSISPFISLSIYLSIYL